MALNPLSLAEMLRPWHAAGVTHLLVTQEDLPDDAQTRQFDTLPSAETVPDHAHNFSDTIVTGSNRRNVEGQPQVRSIPPSSQPSSLPQPAMPPKTPESPLVPVSEWPEAWSALFARTRRSPLIWSYPELGDDLAGRGSKERSQYLRSLIGSLNLPKGSSAFWPLSLSSSYAQLNPDDSLNTSDDYSSKSASPSTGLYFRSGLQLLKPRAVLFFGLSCLELSGLTIPLQSSYTQALSQGVLYILLPDFEDLLQKQDSLETSRTFLRAMLNAIPALFTD